MVPYYEGDIASLVSVVGDERLLAGSDYPHPEGTKDPIGRFEKALDRHAVPEPDRQRFYADNFRDLIPA